MCVCVCVCVCVCGFLFLLFEIFFSKMSVEMGNYLLKCYSLLFFYSFDTVFPIHIAQRSMSVNEDVL